MNLLNNKTFDRDGFIRKFHKAFKEEIMPTLYNLFHKIRRATLSNFETSINYLNTKTSKGHYKKRNQ